jgi:hypothetical protein
VRAIVDRIRALVLPTGVLGLWTDQDGVLDDVLEPVLEAGQSSKCAPAELLH